MRLGGTPDPILTLENGKTSCLLLKMEGVGGEACKNYRGPGCSERGPGPGCMCSCLLGSIICGLYKLTVSDQTHVTLQLRVRACMCVCLCFFVFAHQYKYRVQIFRRYVLARGPEFFLLTEARTRSRRPCSYSNWDSNPDRPALA